MAGRFTIVVKGKKFYSHTRTDFKREAVALAKRLRTPFTQVRVRKFPLGNGWMVYTHPKRR